MIDLIGQINTDMLSKAYGLSSGAPQTSIQGLTAAGNTATNAMMANASAQQGKNEMMGDFGTAAAMAFS